MRKKTYLGIKFRSFLCLNGFIFFFKGRLGPGWHWEDGHMQMQMEPRAARTGEQQRMRTPSSVSRSLPPTQRLLVKKAEKLGGLRSVVVTQTGAEKKNYKLAKNTWIKWGWKDGLHHPPSQPTHCCLPQMLCPFFCSQWFGNCCSNRSINVSLFGQTELLIIYFYLWSPESILWTKTAIKDVDF